MKRDITKARHDGYRIVYIDETVFTRKTFSDKEWCLPQQNVTIDQDQLNETTLALLSGISREKGQEHFKIFEKSVNIPKFKQYLEELREKNPGEKIALFMDNLSVHISKKTKDTMQKNGFKWIFNLPYEPEYNPIECTFSKIKQKFKSLRA